MRRLRSVLAGTAGALVVILSLSIAAPALAAQDDPRLDELFAQLHEIEEPRDARRVEAEIWQIWSESGDPRIQELYDQGIITMRAGALHIAADLYSQIIERMPTFAEAWNKRATIRYMLKEYEASIADIEETLKREPRHFGALFGLGLCYIELGRDADAIEAFKRTLEVDPHQTGAYDYIRALTKRMEERAI